MIDWKKSAKLNKCSIKELKARFSRFPKSTKKVVAVCDRCGKERFHNFQKASSALCNTCERKQRYKNPEARKKQSDAAMGHEVTKKTREKLRKAAVKQFSDPEARKRNSESHKGKLMGDSNPTKRPEVREKIRKSKKGKPRSEESKRKVSATKQGIPYDEWKNFACRKNYCPKFTEACRESNREKYGRKCFICGKSEKANGQKLSVHHVDMNKAQGCESNWKLVPLCKHHHATSHNDELIARLGYLLKDA